MDEAIFYPATPEQKADLWALFKWLEVTEDDLAVLQRGEWVYQIQESLWATLRKRGWASGENDGVPFSDMELEQVKNFYIYVDENEESMEDLGYGEEWADIFCVLRRYGATWYSDWKFEPEEMEAIVRNLLGWEEWEWEYPEETYSEELFPYVQAALERDGLVLCDVPTGDDGYLFAIFWLDDIEAVQATAQRLDLEVEIC